MKWGVRVAIASAATALLAMGAWGQGRGRGGATANRQPLEFRNLGPAVGGGRVCCVVGIPGQPNVYYVGAAAGGVWKTTDGGFTWSPIFEHEPVASIGALALAPSNPNLVWVGTGEANIRNDVMVGHGVYYSPDAGETWQEIAPDVFHNVGQISRIVINPDNSNEVWVAVLGHAWGPNTDRGVYRTTDGGKTWQKTLFIDDHTGAIDLAIQPGNPRVLVAAMWDVMRYPWTLDDGGPGSGIYRSNDGGATWKRIEQGLPPGPYGRIGVGFAPSDPNRLYALVQAKTGLFYRSDDAGDHWTAVSDSDNLDARPFYFSRFAVAPDNPDRIYFLSTNLSVSNDGGRTTSALGRVHSDNHSIWIDPKDPERIIEGNDGGVYTSADAGAHFTFHDNIPIEEEYMVSVSPDRPYNLCAGLQDNNAWCGPSQSAASLPAWRTVVGGDGEYAVFSPEDGHVIYADSQNGSIERLDTRTNVSHPIMPYELGVESIKPADLKYRFNWTSPIEAGPASPNEVYIGGNVLFKSTDGGWSWTPISPDLTRNDKSKQINSGGDIVWDITGAETYDTILSFRVSTVDPNTIWVGTDDGLVQVTHDGGKNWSRVSDNIANLPQWGRVQQIETSPFDANTCYVAFDLHESDDNRPYVYKTHDGGKTWTSISAGLPQDASARVIREDPNDRGFLVVGTDTGLFYSRDDGSTWTPLQYGFPTVPVFDLAFVKDTHDLVVATHGRGFFVLDDIVPLEQMTPDVMASDFHLFPILPDVRYHGGGRGGFGGGGAGGGNPPEGVVINYYLKDNVRGGGMGGGAGMAAGGGRGRGGRGGGGGGPVKVTITDAQGNVISSLSGSGRAGLNQVIWRGNYDGPHTLDFITGGRGGGGGGGFGGGAAAAAPGMGAPDAGPAALAGTYKVTVSVNGETQTEEAVIKEDPRFPTNPANFAATLKAGLEARDQLSAVADMLNRLDALNTQLTAAERTLRLQPEAEQAKYTEVFSQANALQHKVLDLEHQLYSADAEKNEATADLRAFYQQFQTVYGAISRGYDEAPRPGDLALWAQMQTQAQGYLDAYNAIVRNDVVAFNKAASTSGAITVVAGGPIVLPSAPAVSTASRQRP